MEYQRSKNRIISGIVIAAAVILLGTALFIDLGKGFPSGARTRTIMLYGIGSNLVEIVSTCSTGWKKSPVEANKWMEDNMFKFYQIGDLKDVRR